MKRINRIYAPVSAAPESAPLAVSPHWSNHIRSALFALAAGFAMIASALPVCAQNAKVQEWSPGWDDVTQTLDYKHSFVKFNQPSGGKLEITYYLHGAVPNTAHLVGVHVGFGGVCPVFFGTLPLAGGCATATRQGRTANVSSYDLGTLTTDAHGDGTLSVTISQIATGTYEMEFHVRMGPTCPANCPVIYQSPGPFDTVVARLQF